jgi:ribonuclease HII
MIDKVIVAGADEAGRGCVIGPLVIAGVSIEAEKEHLLKKMGVKDSKLLSPGRREKLAEAIEKIAKDIIVVKVAACKIDTYRKDGINLNKLEGMKFAEVINYLEPHKAFVDCPDVNMDRMSKFISKMVQNDVELVVEHKADFNYPTVAAASIIAKVERDADIAELREKHGDFGSGYSSDPRTVQWLEEWLANNKEFPDCVRNSWDTVNVIKADRAQSKLSGWLKGFGKK